MSQDEFTKLFTYMERRFDKIEAELEKKADAGFVYAALDAILKNQETEKQERLAINRQLARHEHWIEKAAYKLNLPYSC